MRDALKVAIISILLILLTELVLRTIYKDSMSIWHGKLHKNFFEHSDTYHHVYRKNLANSDNDGVKISTNSLGWNDSKEINVEKEINEFRIFILGDSNTFGVCNNENQKIPKILQTKLSNYFKNTKLKIKVFNLSVISYSTVIYYQQLRYIASKYKPNLIFLNYDPTDPMQDHIYLSQAQLNSKEDIIEFKKVIKQKNSFYKIKKKVIYYLRKNSVTYNFIRRYLHGLFYDSDTLVANKWASNHWDSETIAQAKTAEKYLVKIINLSKANHYKFVLAYTPWFPSISFSYNQSVEFLNKIAIDKKVDFINAYDNFKTLDKDILMSWYYFNDYTHLNCKGLENFGNFYFDSLISKCEKYFSTYCKQII